MLLVMLFIYQAKFFLVTHKTIKNISGFLLNLLIRRDLIEEMFKEKNRFTYFTMGKLKTREDYLVIRPCHILRG